eukprot:2529740-Rhodomonas_salina.1
MAKSTALCSRLFLLSSPLPPLSHFRRELIAESADGWRRGRGRGRGRKEGEGGRRERKEREREREEEREEEREKEREKERKEGEEGEREEGERERLTATRSRRSAAGSTIPALSTAPMVCCYVYGVLLRVAAYPLSVLYYGMELRVGSYAPPEATAGSTCGSSTKSTSGAMRCAYGATAPLRHVRYGASVRAFWI